MRLRHIILSTVIGGLPLLVSSPLIQAHGSGPSAGSGLSPIHAHTGHAHARHGHGRGSRDHRVRQGFALESGTPGHSPLHTRSFRGIPPKHFHGHAFKPGTRIIVPRFLHWRPEPESKLQPHPYSHDIARPFSYYQERADLYRGD